jgi:TonB-linked SusC/RagA family outer membrane protein
VKGYRENTKTLLLAQLELEHDLSWVVENLKFRVMANTTRKSFYEANRQYKPFYYDSFYQISDGKYILEPINIGDGTEYLDYKEGNKSVDNAMYLESALTYSTTINEVNDISGMLVFTMRESIVSGKDNLQESLPYRNTGLSGRFTYSFDSRYFGEFNFGYNGSERFDENNRFGFFPSAGLAWYASNEEFFNPIKKVVSKLKMKATYGLVGNDAIGDSSDRFFYLSQVNLNEKNRGASFGYDNLYHRNGVNVNRYGNSNITWEVSKKLNLGFEIGLFDDLEIMVDYFTEDRSNILMTRPMPHELGLTAKVRANVGEASSHGIDMSIDYQKYFTNDFWMTARGNFTYATSEFTKYEEPDYSQTSWLSREGQSLRQEWGWIAERLFVDEEEIKNSPTQFGEYMAGDIKYKDINKDGKITDLDKVPIGHPTTPEITYGFGISVGYKGVDASCFFSGNARTSFWLDTKQTSPFADIDTDAGWDDGKITSTALLKAYADSHWSEENANQYATWPRLSNRVIENNNRKSTWFMQDGSFLRLKSVELGYSLPQSLIKPFKMTKCRFYLSATNLAVWSSFDLWDPEMGGNGLGYPIQRQISVGLNINF